MKPGFGIEIATSGETPVDLTGANGFVFRPTVPCEIVRYGVVVTTALTGALTVTGNHRQAGGAALTPSGAGDVGTITSDATETVGTVLYTAVVNPNAEFGQTGGDRDSAGTETALTYKPFLVLPGEEVQFVGDGNPSVGQGVIFVHYRVLGWQDNPTYRARAALTAPVADDGWLVNTDEKTS